MAGVGHPLRGSRGALSYRQREVLLLALNGNSNQEIANELTISINTVKSHLADIYVLLGVSGRRAVTELLSNDPELRRRILDPLALYD